MLYSAHASGQSEIVLSRDGKAPKWAMLLPAGEISGVDGRDYVNDQPDIILSGFGSNGLDLVVDWEHQSVFAAAGERYDAGAWITSMENREGAIWGKLRWTKEGRKAVESQSQRYLSPYIAHTPDGHIVGILSCALVNQPNFEMPPLTAAASSEMARRLSRLDPGKGPDTMAKVSPELRALFKIPAELSDEDAWKAVETARQTSIESSDRAKEAEKALAAQKKADADRVIDVVLDKHQKKFVPAERELWKSVCSQEGGVEKFETAMAARPDIPLDQQTPMPARADLDKNKKADEFEGICASECGLSVEAFQARKKQILSANRNMTPDTKLGAGKWQYTAL